MQALQTINVMKKINSILILIFTIFTSQLFAQDDLMKELQDMSPSKPATVFATFKSTRIITGQSIEHIAAKHLNLVILHRFGEINGGAYTLWGMDQANMRIALEYGINDKIQLGLGRSSIGKTYDGNIKWKILAQSKGKGGMPISLGYYGNIAVNTMEWTDPSIHNYFTSRLSYFHQLNIAKKFNEYLSLQVSPTLAHQNLVQLTNDKNSVFALGLGASWKISRSVRFNVEYYPRLTGRDQLTSSGAKAYDYLGMGFDIETGGHVFQLMFTNGDGMLEQQMLRDTKTQWSNAGIRLGFNLARTFSFENEKTKKSW
jgi:hypothetical protein